MLNTLPLRKSIDKCVLGRIDGLLLAAKSLDGLS
jgi:hypothetical protein